MKERGTAFAIGVLLLGLLLGVMAVWASPALANPDGSAAPSFSGTTIDGKVVSLDSYHGKPLVLLFWGSW